jgi:hypothetical protein
LAVNTPLVEMTKDRRVVISNPKRLIHVEIAAGNNEPTGLAIIAA